MKKILFVSVVVFALSSCSLGQETPKNPEPNSGSTEIVSSGSEEKINSGSVEQKEISNSGNIEKSEDSLSKTDSSIQVLLSFCMKMGIEKCPIEETKLSWNTESNEFLELNGYKTYEKKYLKDPYKLKEELFKDWEMSNPNMADGPSMFSYGYEKGNIVCKISSEPNKVNMENDLPVVDESKGYNLVISCAFLEKKEKDLGTEVGNLELEAHSTNPTWSLVINKTMLTYDSPKNEQKTGKYIKVKTYVKKGEISFEGKNETDTISGFFKKQNCISDGKDHSYFVEIKINGEKQRACGDEFEVEYNKNYDDSLETELTREEKFFREEIKSLFKEDIFPSNTIKKTSLSLKPANPENPQKQEAYEIYEKGISFMDEKDVEKAFTDKGWWSFPEFDYSEGKYNWNKGFRKDNYICSVAMKSKDGKSGEFSVRCSGIED